MASGSGSGTILVSGGSHTINVPVSLDSATNNITVSGSGSTLTFGNSVEGVGAITINPTGAGKVLFEANNTYGGATTIDGGILQVGTGGANGSLGTSASAVANNGTLIMDVTTSPSLTVTGTGTFTQAGSGTTVLNGANSTGAFNINAGMVQLGTGASLAATGDLTVAGGSKLDLNGNNATVGGLVGAGTIDDFAGAGTPTITIGSDGNADAFSGVIQNTTGTVSLVKSGSGTQTLSGVNTFAGGTTITSGALVVTQNNGLGSGTVTVGSANGLQLGNVTLSNPISITVPSSEFEDVLAGDSAILTGAISPTGSNQFRVGTISTTSTINLEGAVTGGTSSIFIITRGNVIVNGNGVTGGASITSSHTSSAILVGRQSTTSTLNLTIENGGQLNSAFGVNMGSGTAGSDDASMNINVFGSGPTAISSISAGGPFNLNDDSNTTATGLTLTLGAYSNLTTTAFQDSSTVSSTSTAVTINGGTITAAANDAVDATVGGNIFLPEFSNQNNIVAGIAINVASGGATINNGGFSISLGESLGDGSGSNTDSVTYTGSGTTVLANENTYQGSTTIAAGTVMAANAGGSATGNGTVNVTGGVLATAPTSEITLLNSSAGTLDNVGSGNIAGPVVVGAAGTIAPGGIGALGTMSLTGLTTTNGSTLNFDLGTGIGVGINGDLLDLTGTVSIGSGTLLDLRRHARTVGDDYRLIGGSISGINLADFTLPAAPAGETFSLSNTRRFGFHRPRRHQRRPGQPDLEQLPAAIISGTTEPVPTGTTARPTRCSMPRTTSPSTTTTQAAHPPTTR